MTPVVDDRPLVLPHEIIATVGNRPCLTAQMVENNFSIELKAWVVANCEHDPLNDVWLLPLSDDA